MTFKNDCKSDSLYLTRRSQLLATLALGFGLVDSVSAQQSSPLKIGVVTPNTGGMASLGDDMARNFELAAEHLNAKGGVNGRQVQIIRGDASTAQEAIAAVEKLIGRDKVHIMTGSIASFLATAASETALNYNVLYWETSSLAKSLTERGLPNFVRTGPSTEHFAAIAVQGTLDLIAKKIGKSPAELKVWLQYEDSAYGTSLVEDQKKLFEKAGVKVQTMGHSMKAIDLSDAILRAKKFAPDVWINAGYVVDTNLLLRTAREQGFKPLAMMLVGVGDTKETLNALGADYLEGLLVATYPRSSVNPKFGPGALELAKAYEAKYKQLPVATSGTNGYVGLLMLARAIETAGGSTAYKDVIAAAKKLDLPIGTYPNGYGIKFDNNMQNTRVKPTLIQWQSGQAVVVYPPEAVPQNAVLRSLARK
jgi:branched-chain amino acid transport system substrate-binding protein